MIAAPAAVLMIGLGAMGLPMAVRLIEAGFAVRGADPSAHARARLEARGAPVFARACEAAADGRLAAVITMLPNGGIVREVLLGEDGVAPQLSPGTLVLDMSSSAPADTLALARDLAARGLPLLDAPVSGGVKRAADGSLAIMVGGPQARIDRARPLLEAMGKAVLATGPIGSGHAMKALNNYVSAAGLVAACEALLVGRRFGIEPETIIDVLNASTGRNNSTEVKMKPFVITETYASGFAMALMAKDVGIAAELAGELGLAIPQIGSVAQIWQAAAAALGPGADHTAIYAYIASIAEQAAP